MIKCHTTNLNKNVKILQEKIDLQHIIDPGIRWSQDNVIEPVLCGLSCVPVPGDMSQL